MNTLTSNQKVLIAALVGFIIGAGAIWVWSVSTSVPNNQSAGETKRMAASAGDTEVVVTPKSGGSTAKDDGVKAVAVAMDNSELVAVKAQAAGMSVTARATFDAPGWVVVHEEREGTLGNVLGAAWLPEGSNDIVVELLRGTVAGQTYHVVLYNDDGDKQFEYKGGDALLLDGSKQPIQASFKAQ